MSDHRTDPQRRRAPGGRGSRGQTLVEFALVLPVFILMLFGMVDFGRFVYMNSVLSQAAREGSRLGSVEAYWIGSSDPSCGATAGPVCPAPAGFKSDVVAAVNRMAAPFGPIPAGQVSVRCDPSGSAPTGAWADAPATCAGMQPGGLVSVRVSLTYTALTPVIGRIVGSITTSGSATMVIN
jgi:hypothetical protein